MWLFSKKEGKPKQTEIFKQKPPKFDITNSPENSYFKSYITLKPINACYYNKNKELTEFVIPRFFIFEKNNVWGTNTPIQQAICIKETGENDIKLRKENWFYENIYVINDELNKYSAKKNFSLTIRKYNHRKKPYEHEVYSEKIEIVDKDFEDYFYWNDKKNYTCAKIFDFYTNMDEEIIKAFGNGLFESLKTYKELQKEMGVSSECKTEIINYVNQIYDTALSIGEVIERFPTIIDYINIHNEEELKKKQEALEKERQFKEKQNQFIRDLKIRQSLLDDFNRPYTKDEKNN